MWLSLRITQSSSSRRIWSTQKDHRTSTWRCSSWNGMTGRSGSCGLHKERWAATIKRSSFSTTSIRSTLVLPSRRSLPALLTTGGQTETSSRKSSGSTSISARRRRRKRCNSLSPMRKSLSKYLSSLEFLVRRIKWKLRDLTTNSSTSLSSSGISMSTNKL